MLCNNIILYPFNSIDEISLSEMSISEMDEMAISENIIYQISDNTLPPVLQLIIKSPLLDILQNNYSNIDHFSSIVYQLALDTPIERIIDAFDEYAIINTNTSTIDDLVLKLSI